MASPLSLFAYIQINWNGKLFFLFSKHFFLENKTRKSKVVKLHRISGEPVSITEKKLQQTNKNVDQKIVRIKGEKMWHKMKSSNQLCAVNFLKFSSRQRGQVSSLLCISTSSRVRTHPEAGRTTFFQLFSSVYLVFFTFFFFFRKKKKKNIWFFTPLYQL